MKLDASAKKLSHGPVQTSSYPRSLTRCGTASELQEDKMSEAQDYSPGYSAQEAQRLAAQTVVFEELTLDVLRRVNLRP